MPKRSGKPSPSPDPNLSAHDAVGRLTHTVRKRAAKRRKDPAAVALGRKGGLKGGKARAAKLSRERLSEIGRQGATARWAKEGQDDY